MLGAYIRQLREQQGHSVREFAALLGKSAGYISRIEARGEIPAPELICRIAELLKGDLNEMLILAKNSQLARTEKEIDEKQASALALYRKQQR